MKLLFFTLVACFMTLLASANDDYDYENGGTVNATAPGTPGAAAAPAATAAPSAAVSLSATSAAAGVAGAASGAASGAAAGAAAGASAGVMYLFLGPLADQLRCLLRNQR
ncbi:hypothetical protein MTO96_033961 [Rhipicephalus appendiculatus]